MRDAFKKEQLILYHADGGRSKIFKMSASVVGLETLSVALLLI